jgi:hypothetical protein
MWGVHEAVNFFKRENFPDQTKCTKKKKHRVCMTSLVIITSIALEASKSIFMRDEAMLRSESWW